MLFAVTPYDEDDQSSLIETSSGNLQVFSELISTQLRVLCTNYRN